LEKHPELANNFKHYDMTVSEKQIDLCKRMAFLQANYSEIFINSYISKPPYFLWT